MQRIYFILSVCSLVACGSVTPLRFLNPPSRMRIYSAKADPSVKCEELLTRVSQNEQVGALVSDTLVDLESEGFANIQINHLPVSKKMFVILVVSDPESGKILHYGCAENIEIEKNSQQELPIVLSAPPQGDGPL